MTEVERLREAWRLRARDIVAKHYDYEVVENVSEHCAEVDFVLQGVVAALQSAAPVEEAVENLVVRITEHAVMELDADEENTLQIEAFGAAVEREIRAALIERLSSTGGQGND